ncbi:unnamed protein product [Cuscuta epithymum]|uniref:BHLH domain-containing protein n=1 Tax=Cuscuta epithymum TaxID=186058 RepID=A0AAV0DK60_9ASTE|nr:unnamed protein product [Cuscuta epithymum]
MDDGGAAQAWTLSHSGRSEEKPGDLTRLACSGGSKSMPPPSAAGTKRSPAEKERSESGVVVESDHEVHVWTERERRKKMRTMFATLHSLLPQLSAKADKSTIVGEAVTYIKSLEQTLHTLQKQKMDMLQRFSYGSSSVLSSQRLNPAPTDQTAAFLAADHHAAGGSGGGGGLLASLFGSLSSSSSPAATNTHYSDVIPRHPPASFQTWTSPNVILNVCGGDAQISICCPKKPPGDRGGGGLLTGICFVLEKYKIEVVSAQVSSDRHRSMCMIQARSGLYGQDLLNETTAYAAVEEIYKQAAGEILLWVTSRH